jgi:hypothetical protein
LMDTFESLYMNRERVVEKVINIKNDYRDKIINQFSGMVQEGIIS